MKKLFALVIVLAVMPNVASAKKFEAEKNGHEVVAHTSRASSHADFQEVSRRGTGSAFRPSRHRRYLE